MSFRRVGSLAVVMVLAIQAAALATPTGELDPLFDSDGITAANSLPPPHMFGSKIAVDQDGRIVIAAEYLASSYFEIGLARFGGSGTLDPSFGTGGIVHLSSGSGTSHLFSRDIAVQADGKILSAGSGGYYWSAMSVARFLDDGTVDDLFGDHGVVHHGFYSNTSGSLTNSGASAIALQANGRIVIAGSAEVPENSDRKIAVVRLMSNGQPDDSLGSDFQRLPE